MSALIAISEETPIFKAVSSSARQLFQLLNCINFASKVQLELSEDGVRFFVEEARIMQAIIFLEKAFFTSFTYYTHYLPTPNDDDENNANRERPQFQISLVALLETLQIFGAADAAAKMNKGDNDGYGTNIRPGRVNAFSAATLGTPGLCRLSYPALGAPFGIILEEAGMTTTCNLNTYESDRVEEIPFDREEIEVKIILQSRFLWDAISELSTIVNTSPTSSTRLSVTASPTAPFFTLSAAGALGNASVEFAKGRELLETFTVAKRWTQSYKFEMVKAAADAMRLASKVSFRGDKQGVLSMQFMVELEGGLVSFIDYRFVPFLRDDDEDEEEEPEEEDENDEYE